MSRHPNPCTRFWAILLTDRQTDRQTEVKIVFNRRGGHLEKWIWRHISAVGASIWTKFGIAWWRIMCRFLANGRNRNRKALFVTKPLHYAQFYGFEEQNSCLKFYIFYRPYMTLQWKPKSCHMTTLQLKTYLLLQSFRAKATIKTH